MTSLAIDFRNQQGNTINARLDLPIGKPSAYALFAHCFTCSKDVLATSRISRALTEHGIAVLRFDFSDIQFSSNIQDLIDAANYLESNYEAPTLLIGHSLGGAAVLAAANQLSSTKAICTIAAPSDPNHVSHFFADRLDDLKNQDEIQVDS